MQISNYMNSAGLFLDLLGAVIIWRFGLPAEISRSGAQHLDAEDVDKAEVAKAKRYDRLSWWGFLSLFAGFALQLASNFFGRSSTLDVRTRIEWNFTLTDPLTVGFTAVIAISTIVYTILTLRLWRTTRASVDIARYNAFMAYMTALVAQIEKVKSSDPVRAKLLEAFSTVIADVAISRFLSEVDFARDKDARADFTRVAEVLRAHGVDPSAIPGLGGILKQMETRP